MTVFGLPITIHRSLLLMLILTFILFTVIGTLSHEMGHYILAVLAGYEPHFGYGYVDWSTDDYSQINTFWDDLITLGGPVQTMLTGSIGLGYILIHKEKFTSQNALSFPQWLWIFMALFWLRQPTNLMIWIGKYLYYGRLSYTSDEVELAIRYHLSLWSIICATGIVGFLVASYISFFIIPKKERLTFILGGLIGGVLGYILWLEILGPIWMP